MGCRERLSTRGLPVLSVLSRLPIKPPPPGILHSHIDSTNTRRSPSPPRESSPCLLGMGRLITQSLQIRWSGHRILWQLTPPRHANAPFFDHGEEMLGRPVQYLHIVQRVLIENEHVCEETFSNLP